MERFCDKPLAFIDLESTGLDIANDRIIQIGIVKVDYGNTREKKHHPHVVMDALVNPCRPIPDAISQLTGIKTEHVENAPRFRDIAAEILDVIAGCDLVGFNLRQFDVPLLAEEMDRAGFELVLDGVKVIDCGVVMKRKEGRTLADAVRMYCRKEITQHHSAAADAMSTYEVFWGQIGAYGFESLDQLAEWGKHEDDNRIDFVGKLGRDKDGDPIFTFGARTRGVKVKDDIGFARWMLDRDFPSDTKRHLRRILEAISEAAAAEIF